MKKENTPEENTRKSTYSSIDMSGVSLQQQLKYVRITTKELTLMLWDYWRKWYKRQNTENK